MAQINILDTETINKIAAGEVVERPVNVVKELVENSIDSGASAITVEIKNGGIDLIRVTDNGCGIEPDQITKAFKRHATSKIKDSDDLSRLMSLGFRGEALSSIAAVSQVEMITKTAGTLEGVRASNANYENASFSITGKDSGSLQTTDVIPLDISSIGAPDGTTVIVRNIFYNVPVRKKFLKAPSTEAGYITDVVEHMALSHPEISFHYRVNNQEKLHTTGNGNEKELIYRIYGRDMASSVIPIKADNGTYSIEGYLGRPEFSRSSRNYEVFFVNDRILKSDVLSKALEEGYRTDLMQHRFPFAILHITSPADETDVNVHPAKMEVRFSNSRSVYDFINESVHSVLHKTELIPAATLDTAREESKAAQKEKKERALLQKELKHTEPFENAHPAAKDPLLDKSAIVREAAPVFGDSFNDRTSFKTEGFTFDDIRPAAKPESFAFDDTKTSLKPESLAFGEASKSDKLAVKAFDDDKNVKPDLHHSEESTKLKMDPADSAEGKYVQQNLFDKEGGNEHILSTENVDKFTIVGQVFKTYWIVEYQNKMLMIDQHAAHEKVNFERLMKRLEKDKTTRASQLIAPPIILTLTGKEEAAYLQFCDTFAEMGYEIEDFGDSSYAIRAIPSELYANEPAALVREVIDEIIQEKVSGTSSAILYKIASMSCKAAVKGNSRLSFAEAKALINELLSLDDPYHCPHGRPTVIEMDQKEIERKFKRIV